MQNEDARAAMAYLIIIAAGVFIGNLLTIFFTK